MSYKIQPLRQLSRDPKHADIFEMLKTKYAGPEHKWIRDLPLAMYQSRDGLFEFTRHRSKWQVECRALDESASFRLEGPKDRTWDRAIEQRCEGSWINKVADGIDETMALYQVGPDCRWPRLKDAIAALEEAIEIGLLKDLEESLTEAFITEDSDDDIIAMAAKILGMPTPA